MNISSTGVEFNTQHLLLFLFFSIFLKKAEKDNKGACLCLFFFFNENLTLSILLKTL